MFSGFCPSESESSDAMGVPTGRQRRNGSASLGSTRTRAKACRDIACKGLGTPGGEVEFSYLGNYRLKPVL
jgi:hypothetical protein